MTARRWSGLAAALILLALAVALSISVGTRSIPLLDVWRLVLGGGDNLETDILRDGRVPRTLLGLEVGASLALAGALMQALTRNPLADPGLLGVNAGAAAGVVAAMAAFGVTSFTGYVWFAIAGAALTTLLVYALGSRGAGSATPARLVLAGLAVTATLTAAITAVVLTNPRVFDQFRTWEVGSLSGRGGVAPMVAPFAVAGVAAGLLLARQLNALALGDDMGRALGAMPVRTRAGSIVAITALCGAATAAVGPMVFVGLAVPQIARIVCGADHRWIAAYSLLLGPVLVLVADVIGRVADRPGELQAGVVVAFLGAPFFIALVRRDRIGTG
ncbi:MAG: FecCD family ABC transporter permease [Thermoleophilia bacterium]